MHIGGGQSIFDNFTKKDFIIAFFPCIYFCDMSQMMFSWGNKNYRTKSIREASDLILERSHNREYFFGLAVKMVTIAKERHLRLVMENPWTGETFLHRFVKPPSVIDRNRRLRGDYYTKPTAYWFFNCEPTNGFTACYNPIQKTVKKADSAPHGGLCSEERSLMAPEYAHNFIIDFILGKQEIGSLGNLF